MPGSTSAGQSFIDTLVEPVLRNWNGIEVGRLRPAPALAAPAA